MAIPGRDVRVFVQAGDEVLEISGVVNSFTITNNYTDVTGYGCGDRTYMQAGQVEASFSIIGHGTWSTVDKITKRTERQEWKCDFCGHVNPIKARYCGHKDRHVKGCGARRSFIIDALDEK